MEKPGALPPGFLFFALGREKTGGRKAVFAEKLKRLGPEPRALDSVARVFHRGHEIFLAFALEFFLGDFEICNAHCDLFTRLSEPVLPFGHDHPFFYLVQGAWVVAIGA